MENLLLKYKNRNNYTYILLTKKINNQLKLNGVTTRVDRTTISCYCRKNILPINQNVLEAIVDLLQIDKYTLIENFNLCKNEVKVC